MAQQDEPPQSTPLWSSWEMWCDFPAKAPRGPAGAASPGSPTSPSAASRGGAHPHPPPEATWLDSVRSIGVFDTAEGFWGIRSAFREA